MSIIQYTYGELHYRGIDYKPQLIDIPTKLHHLIILDIFCIASFLMLCTSMQMKHIPKCIQ